MTQALALCYIRLFPTTLKECNFFIQNDRSLGQWMRELYMTMLEKPVVARPVRNESRYLIEQKFNISIEQQLMLEEHFNTLTDTHMIFKCGLEIAKDLTDYFCDYANQSLIHIGTRAFPRSYMPMQMTFAGFDENLSTHQMNGTIKNNSQSSRKRNPKIEKGEMPLPSSIEQLLQLLLPTLETVLGGELHPEKQSKNEYGIISFLDSVLPMVQKILPMLLTML